MSVTSGAGAPLPVLNGTCLFGICSSGTAYTPTSVGSIVALTDTFGQGPLVDAAALYLQITGQPVYVCRVTQSSAGTISAITATRAGTSTGTVANNASAPVNAYSLIIIIVTTGTVAATSFTYKYSVDGGNNYSAILQGAAAVTLGTTGIILTFADAGGGPTYFEAGDTFTVTTVAPVYNTSNLTSAVTALINDPNTRVRRIHAVNTNGASFHSTLITLRATAFTAYKYFRVVEESDDLGAGPETVTAWQAGTNSDFLTQSNSTVIIAGWQQTLLQTQQDGVNQQRNVPIAWSVGPVIAAGDVSQDPGRAPSINGPLPNTVVDSTYPIRQDCRLYTGFEGLGITYGQSYVGLQGLYCAGGFTRIANSSDVYYRLARCQVIDLACEITYSAMLAYLNVTLQANANGTIAEQAAQAIEADLNSKLSGTLVNVSPQRISPTQNGRYAVMDRTNNVVTTSQLKVTITFVPLGYVSSVSVTIGYALAAN